MISKPDIALKRESIYQYRHVEVPGLFSGTESSPFWTPTSEFFLPPRLMELVFQVTVLGQVNIDILKVLDSTFLILAMDSSIPAKVSSPSFLVSIIH